MTLVSYLNFDLEKLDLVPCIYRTPRGLSYRQKRAFSLIIDAYNHTKNFLLNDESSEDRNYHSKAVAWLTSYIDKEEGTITWLTEMSYEEVKNQLDGKLDINNCAFATIKDGKISYDSDFIKTDTIKRSVRKEVRDTQELVNVVNNGPGLCYEVTLFDVQEGVIHYFNSFFSEYDLDEVLIMIENKVFDIIHNPQKGLVADCLGVIAKIYIEGKEEELAMNKFLTYLRDAEMIDFEDYNKYIQYNEIKYVNFSYSLDNKLYKFKDLVTNKLYILDKKYINYSQAELKEIYKFELLLLDKKPCGLKKCDYNQEIELKIRRERENIKVSKQNQTTNIKLSIRLDACIYCAMCEYKCKNEAIKVLDNEVIWDKDKCNGCMICVKKCPTQAIDVIN